MRLVWLAIRPHPPAPSRGGRGRKCDHECALRQGSRDGRGSKTDHECALRQGSRDGRGRRADGECAPPRDPARMGFVPAVISAPGGPHSPLQLLPSRLGSPWEERTRHCNCSRPVSGALGRSALGPAIAPPPEAGGGWGGGAGNSRVRAENLLLSINPIEWRTTWGGGRW
jgi:hypothetical protein